MAHARSSLSFSWRIRATHTLTVSSPLPVASKASSSRVAPAARLHAEGRSAMQYT